MKLTFFRRNSASVARERLQILLEFERRTDGPDMLSVLRDEIVAAISKHISLDDDKIQVKIDRGKFASILEIDVEVPNTNDAIRGSLI